MNYKQYKNFLREGGDMALNNMYIEEHSPAADDILDIPIAKFITLYENSCGYSGTDEELIVYYIHPLLLKANAASYREYILTGMKLLISSLTMSIGMQRWWKFRLWSRWVLG